MRTETNSCSVISSQGCSYRGRSIEVVSVLLIASDIGERVWSKFTASISCMLGEIDLALIASFPVRFVSPSC